MRNYLIQGDYVNLSMHTMPIPSPRAITNESVTVPEFTVDFFDCIFEFLDVAKHPGQTQDAKHGHKNRKSPEKPVDKIPKDLKPKGCAKNNQHKSLDEFF